MPRTEKVAISLPKTLLNRVDREATRRAVSRSAVIREALEDAFDVSLGDPVVAKAARVYAEIAEEDRRLSQAFLQISAPPPPYEVRPKQRAPR
jgi:predicted transcriptional regulator